MRPMQIRRSQDVSVGGSVVTLIGPMPIGETVIRVVARGNVKVRLSGTTGDGALIPAGIPEYFRVPPGNTLQALSDDAGTHTVNVAVLTQ